MGMTKGFKYSFLKVKQMINLQPYFFFNKTDTNLCFRIFGYGLNFIDRDKQPALYSVRSGSKKQWKVFKYWHVIVLKPIKYEGVGRP